VNLEVAQALALSLMAQHGLRDNVNFGTPKYWHFKFNHRRRHIGLCSYRERTIYLSKPLVLVNSEEDVKDTILHEIAHVKAGGLAGHGRMWKLEAMAIGARPQSCSMTKKPAPGRYQAICPGCNAVHYKYRRPRSNGSSACAHCCHQHNGGRYTDRFVLNFMEASICSASQASSTL
jgi:predicted SprT family Zn-dependent metalloprotease